MKICARIVLTLFVTFIAGFVFLGVSTQNGVEIRLDQGFGEVNYFATVGGTGNCSSWNAGCTFRTAVSKCTGTKQCNIYLGAGIHETNNVSDATGTTVSANYVRIIGFGDPDEIGQSSQLANGHAGATHVLRVTGSRFAILHVAFDQSAQADKIAIHLNLRGSYNTVRDCVFRQTVADGANTGILMDNSGVSFTIEGCRFRRLEGSGIEFGAAQRFYLNNNVFWKCTKGLYASSGSADGGIFRFNTYMACTTAWDMAAAVAKEWYSLGATFANNTTNFGDVAAYGGTIFIENATTSGRNRAVYPAGAGTLVQKNANAYTWGNYVDLIAAGTFAKPIRIQALNFQTWNSAQIFKIELFYGSASPGTTSLGIYEVVLGDPAAANKVYTPINATIYIPAFANVGAKLMSSTAGIDDVTITLGYDLL
jgi:hypothetical protein